MQQDLPVAIVGGGLVGFCAYVTLLRLGVPAAEVVVLGRELDPAGAWSRRAAAIRQRSMRSESDGHCLPATFPGLALRAAARRRSLRPVAESVLRGYHPSVQEFLAHVVRLREASGWDERVVQREVAQVTAVPGGFLLDGEGPFAHVFLATGHPGLALPDELAGDPRAVHAYEPHGYADEVAVVGAGMAAATE